MYLLQCTYRDVDYENLFSNQRLFPSLQVEKKVSCVWARGLFVGACC